MVEQRGKRAWRKADVARESGLSPGYVNNLESGERLPTNEALAMLAKAFEVEADWLIAQVDTARIGPEGIERLRKYAPGFLGLPTADFAERMAANQKQKADELRERMAPYVEDSRPAAASWIDEGEKGDEDEQDAPGGDGDNFSEGSV